VQRKEKVYCLKPQIELIPLCGDYIDTKLQVSGMEHIEGKKFP
jgi:hypothetical protein